jgi:hypothetical protein
MAEQVRLVMPKIKKLKLSSASDDGVWESFAWTIEPFNKLAAEAKELLFDGTRTFSISRFLSRNAVEIVLTLDTT